MARLRQSEAPTRASTVDSHDTLYRDPTPLPGAPAHSVSSDKENSPNPASMSKSTDTVSGVDTNSEAGERSAKRRRLAERQDPNGSLTAMASESARRNSVSETAQADPRTRFYDPHQDMDERREIRKSMRDLTKELTDSRNDLLRPENNKLREHILRADENYKRVKQTSDATIDSSFLVEAGDLTFRRSRAANFGSNGSTGIDVEEFVGKCLAFMRDGDTQDQAYAQRRRRATQINDNDGDGDNEADDGDAVNWSWLGARACFPVIRRPSTKSFLLGPLSVEKRARARAVRQQREKRPLPGTATQAQELKADELNRNEDANLVVQCNKVLENHESSIELAKHRGAELWDQAAEMTEEEAEQKGLSEADILRDTGLSEDGNGLSLLKFAINPQSFAQSVENLFHISFLVRDDRMKIEKNREGLPLLCKLTCTDTS